MKGLEWIHEVLLECVNGGDIVDDLVLEAIEDNDDKPVMQLKVSA
jgi:hypothetical protein